MTLTVLLEIERGLLTGTDELGLGFAEALWIREGSPVERNELCRAIENILRTCEREGIHYPAILLRRKKELERGAWKPRPARPARPALSARTSVSVPADPAISAGEAVVAVRAAAGIPAPQKVPGRIAGQVAAPPQIAATPQNSSQAARACELCGGSGIVRSEDGQTGRACECFLHWAQKSGLA